MYCLAQTKDFCDFKNERLNFVSNPKKKRKSKESNHFPVFTKHKKNRKERSVITESNNQNANHNNTYGLFSYWIDCLHSITSSSVFFPPFFRQLSSKFSIRWNQIKQMSIVLRHNNDFGHRQFQTKTFSSFVSRFPSLFGERASEWRFLTAKGFGNYFIAVLKEKFPNFHANKLLFEKVSNGSWEKYNQIMLLEDLKWRKLKVTLIAKFSFK